MPRLHITGTIPEGLLKASARDLSRVLHGPTLIELGDGPGRPLFVSALMHGNEDAGLIALQMLLRDMPTFRLPRPLMILIGNVSAASQGLRRLDGQPDYNRVWPGCTHHQSTAEAQMMAQIHQRVIDRGAFAAIDIHNNTGRNPHYAVICESDTQVMALARLFAPRAVLFRGLPGTQTASFSGILPAITLECGQSGIDANAAVAARMIRAVLALPTLDSTSETGAAPLTLFHTLGQVRVRRDVALTRSGGQAWLALAGNLDLHNFQPVPAGLAFGETTHPMPLEVIDEAGADVAGEFFCKKGNTLVLSRAAVPAMLTMEERIIRQDCLCYLMEELPPKP